MEDVLPWADVSAPPATREGVRYTDLSQITSEPVPRERFFVLQHGPIPDVDGASFRLSIEGELEKPLGLSLEALRRFPKREMEVAFECAGNGRIGMHGLVGNAVFGGAPLRAVLEPLGLRESARELVFEGADEAIERLRGQNYPSRFARSLPVDLALTGDVLLAYELNGEALSRENGFPLRLIVPGWYGVAQVKWLERIEVLDRRFMGWFMAKDYVTVRGEETDGRIEHRATSVSRQRLKSIVTRVTRDAERYRIEGLVWNDGSPLQAVEVRVDQGPFVEARLAPRESRWAWTSFDLDWTDATPGRHRIVARARDAHGSQPTEEDASRFKATPWENDGQVVREIVIPRERDEDGASSTGTDKRAAGI